MFAEGAMAVMIEFARAGASGLLFDVGRLHPFGRRTLMLFLVAQTCLSLLFWEAGGHQTHRQPFACSHLHIEISPLPGLLVQQLFQRTANTSRVEEDQIGSRRDQKEAPCLIQVAQASQMKRAALHIPPRSFWQGGLHGGSGWLCLASVVDPHPLPMTTAVVQTHLH